MVCVAFVTSARISVWSQRNELPRVCHGLALGRLPFWMMEIRVLYGGRHVFWISLVHNPAQLKKSRFRLSPQCKNDLHRIYSTSRVPKWNHLETTELSGDDCILLCYSWPPKEQTQKKPKDNDHIWRKGVTTVKMFCVWVCTLTFLCLQLTLMNMKKKLI